MRDTLVKLSVVAIKLANSKSVIPVDELAIEDSIGIKALQIHV